MFNSNAVLRQPGFYPIFMGIALAVLGIAAGLTLVYTGLPYAGIFISCTSAFAAGILVPAIMLRRLF